MCGIAGMVSSRPVTASQLTAMASAIAHRGPDDDGHWISPDGRVGFGHRRLAIVDLSPLGKQPMTSHGGRYVLCYNGEIYNHGDLRATLESGGLVSAWHGHSDTEVLLEAIAAWGLEEALKRSAGMFALALWDKVEDRLFLARDRFGEKPLYYGWTGGDFVFGSELKAIRTHPHFDNDIERDALGLFAARNYIPAPLSIYRGLYKLEPGCILSLTPAAARQPRNAPPRVGENDAGLRLERYWSYGEVMRAGFADPIEDEREALERLEEVLAAAIKGQSVADVPVGAFLSGGIDSSTVVALYQKYSSIPVRTFSIGFEETGFNEAEYARQVAERLGTVHHEEYVTIKEARDVIPLLPAMYDEPFADSSQIPTYLVSRMARRHVTVALSGDGGDELFAGYRRHFAAPELWARLQQLPRPVRAMVGQSLGSLPPKLWDSAARLVRHRGPPHFGAKIQKALKVAGSARTFDDIYHSFIDEWHFDGTPVRGDPQAGRHFDPALAPNMPDAITTMYRDAMSYLPDDILCKVDRASMAVSLESRVPFLDHRVADVAAHIPLHMKVRDGQGKHILRKLLYREAPQSLFERPKAGFAVPVGEWIRASLRDWAELLLDGKHLREQGFFDEELVHQRWAQHCAGERDWTASLWAVLMFQAWLREVRA